jgi:hypothetical protein
MATRLGLRQTADITAIADGARWIWRQLDKHLPGVAGVLDIYHASEQLWVAAHQHLGEGAAEACAWVEGRRATLLRQGVSGLLGELSGAEWSGVRGYFEPHGDHSDYAGRLALGQSIGSGMVEGACKQCSAPQKLGAPESWK